MKYNKKIVSVLMALALGVTSLGFTACSEDAAPKTSAGAESQPSRKTASQNPVSRDLFAMDTIMTINVWGNEAEAAADAAIAEINRIDAMVSTGAEDSEITLLNHEKAGKVSEGTGYMIQRSLDLYASTGGLFDISIYPVMRAWGFTNQEFKVPEEGELEELLGHVQADQVSYQEDTREVHFQDEAVEIDLGGIAKGYTSDQVLKIIDSYDVDCALINLGGNVKTLHKKVNGEEWRIAIQDPEHADQMAGVVTCSDQAVITSGGYQRYFEEAGITYHHIIDPRTGYPAKNGLISVSIVSPDGTLADGLSTSLFIMGLEKAGDYWREHKDEFDAILIDDEGMIYVTAGLKDRFSSDRKWSVIE